MFRQIRKKRLEQAFVDVYTSNIEAVFRYCLVRTGSRELALDLSQEAFMRLWDNMSAGKKIDNLRAFVFRIAKNSIIDWYRKKKTVSLEALGETSGGDGQEWDVLERLIIEENGWQTAVDHADGQYVLEKISELEETFQEAVFLRFVEDLKPKEIAEILGVSANVVSVRISRGLEKLRELIGEKGTDDSDNSKKLRHAHG